MLVEQRVGDEGAEHLGAVGPGAVGEDRAEQAQVHADEPLGGLLDGDVGRSAPRAAMRSRKRPTSGAARPTTASGPPPTRATAAAAPCRSSAWYQGSARTASAWRSRPSTTQSAGSASSSSSASSRSAIAAEPTDEHLADELVLVGDVAVDRRPRAAGPAGHLVHPDGERAVLGDHLGGRRDQPLAQVEAPARRTRRCSLCYGS